MYRLDISLPADSSISLSGPDNRSGSVDARQRGALHEALPLVERVGVLAGKVDVSRRQSLESGNRRELAGQVAGVAASRQRVRRPVLEVSHDVAIHAPRRRLRTGKYQFEIGEEAFGLQLYIAGIE